MEASMRASLPCNSTGHLCGRLSAERTQDGKRIVQIPGDYMHGKIFAESSGYGCVGGTDIDLGVAELRACLRADRS